MTSVGRGQAFLLHPVAKRANLRSAAIPQKAQLLFIPFISLPSSILSVPHHPSHTPALLLAVLFACPSEMTSGAVQIEQVSGRSPAGQ